MWCIADSYMCSKHVQDFFMYSSLGRAMALLKLGIWIKFSWGIEDNINQKT